MCACAYSQCIRSITCICSLRFLVPELVFVPSFSRFTGLEMQQCCLVRHNLLIHHSFLRVWSQIDDSKENVDSVKPLGVLGVHVTGTAGLQNGHLVGIS